MSSLVVELQRDALNPNVKRTDLLRKALVVAVNLKLPRFAKWIRCELDGYFAMDADIPIYRHVVGRLMRRGFAGWIIVRFPDDKVQERICATSLAHSVPEIDYFLTEDTDQVEVNISFPSSTHDKLVSQLGDAIEYRLFVSKAQLHKIIEAVRTAILDWALELKSNGVLGDADGMVFSETEKEIATNINFTVNYFLAGVNNSQIQQHTSESQQK